MSKTIRVSLVVGGDPAVQMDPIVLGKPKIKWRRDSDSTTFDFAGISGLPDSFTVTKSTGKKINVTDSMVSGDYPYTITVTKDGHTYTSNAAVPPDTGGKPVIRN